MHRDCAVRLTSSRPGVGNWARGRGVRGERCFDATFSEGWAHLNSAIAEAPIESEAGMRVASRGVLAAAMAVVVALHAVLIMALQPHAIAASRNC